MDAPKISILIPMYNRKHYIKDCIDSALNQTFQDFEIIIRDNCSTDGSVEFVEKLYSKEISAGKIRLIRNEKNVLLDGSSNRLMVDATGKYITFLHSDDILLPHALQHLYEVAEENNADVVHESGCFEVQDDAEDDDTAVRLHCWDKHPTEQVQVISDDPAERFKEWLYFGTFHDVQYNLLKREFMLDNEIFFQFDYRLSALWWIMLSKILVKTPLVCYVRRIAPDSGSSNLNLNKMDTLISMFVEACRDMDKKFQYIKFFRDSEENQYTAKLSVIDTWTAYFIQNAGFYKNGISLELHHEVANAFKKYFGDDYFYPTILFHYQNALLSNQIMNLVSTPSRTPEQNDT